MGFDFTTTEHGPRCRRSEAYCKKRMIKIHGGCRVLLTQTLYG
jgi:hypothetical protein